MGLFLETSAHFSIFPASEFFSLYFDITLFCLLNKQIQKISCWTLSGKCPLCFRAEGFKGKISASLDSLLSMCEYLSVSLGNNNEMFYTGGH